MFVLLIGISKSPIEIILWEDETKRKSTSFTSSFDLERTDDGCSSFIVVGSLAVMAHSPTSFLTYPSLVQHGNSSNLMGLIMPWPLTLKPFLLYPILFYKLEPIPVVWFSKPMKSSTRNIHEDGQLPFTSHGSHCSFSKASSFACI